MDNSFKLNDGLRTARKLLLELNDSQVPTAGEFLDMITPQYMADLMCWGAIGARTTDPRFIGSWHRASLALWDSKTVQMAPSRWR